MSRTTVPNGVLLADDDPLMCEIIRAVLARAGRRVFVASNGAEAVGLAEQWLVSLVLLDIGMPNLSGLLTCEAIRAMPDYAEVPIVMLTGYGDKRMRQSALELGANEFITKPFRPEELLAKLAPYIEPPAA